MKVATILGDTNSSVGALIAARLGIPVYHLEAGNRCHGHQSPEEVNRRAIDHTATVHLCYSERARMNLVQEGLPLARTFVVGNPLSEVLLDKFAICDRDGRPEPTPWMRASWERAGLGEPGFLATLHRAENVDDPERLVAFLDAIQGLCVVEGTKPLPGHCDDGEVRCLMSTHPRTRARLAGGEAKWPSIRFSDPLHFGEFVALEAIAQLVLSDSGTAPEECIILGRPLVVLRDYMERQEVWERGGCALWSPGSPTSLEVAAGAVLDRSGPPVPVPTEYAARPVAATVARLLLSPVPPV